LPDGILKKALLAPYEIIRKNGVKVVSDVYDSTKVVRTALEQACSTGWLLINTKTVIAFRSVPDMKDAAEIIARELAKRE